VVGVAIAQGGLGGGPGLGGDGGDGGDGGHGWGWVSTLNLEVSHCPIKDLKAEVSLLVLI